MSDPYSEEALWAQSARKDPQAHIDALVEAGVLREIRMSGSYQVVQPHKHRFVCECGVEHDPA